MGKGKHQPLDVCLCLKEYNEQRRTLTYEFVIKGKGKTLADGRSIEYDSSALFTTTIKPDANFAFIVLQAVRPWAAPGAGPDSKVTIYELNGRTIINSKGQEAFWDSYAVATTEDGFATVGGDPLDWFMHIPDGSITIGRNSPVRLSAAPSGPRCNLQ